jgi:trimeric autotransporter adhesin
MNKVIRNCVIKFSFVLFVLSTSIQSFAQVDIAIGTSTTTNTGNSYPCPIQDWYEGSRAQYLYRASELIAAGMGPGTISALKWNVTGLNTFTGTVDEFTIKMGTTTATALSLTTWEPGTAQVRNPQNYVPTVGVNTMNLSTPFFWNGVDNIIVETCNGSVTSTFTNNPSITLTTGLAFIGSHTYRVDAAGNLCNTTTTTNTGAGTDRPNIIFTWTSAVSCSGSPIAGTTVATPNITCATIPFDLNITGATSASGLTYQWQSSPDGVNWTNISTATTPSFTTSQVVTTWYRRAITCTNSSVTTFSTPVQVTSPTLVGGTFTINNGAATGGTNFASFNDAYNYIKCGINAPVIFNVVAASGPYTEQLIITPVPGASAVNTVTFNGNGRTLQFNSTNTNERAVIKLNGADHFTFNDLNITALGSATTEYGFGVQLINNADSNKITNCIINVNKTSTSTNFAGIVMSASATSAVTTGTTLCDFNEFSGNTITGGYYGITMVGSTTDAVGRNKVLNNKLLDQYFYAMYLLGNFDALIQSNEISRPTRTGNATLSYGIFVTSLNTKVVIDKNRIFNPFGAELTTTNDYYAINHSGSDALATLENYVTNNAIYNLKGNGTFYAIHNTSSDNVWYYHNTVEVNDPTSTSTETVRGFFQTTLAGGIEFKNNLIQINRGGSGTKFGVYYNTNTTQFVSNRNNFDITPSATSFTGFFNANRTSLVDWQTATTQDANSITINPVFVNASSGNLLPTNASMNDLGEGLGVTTDIINTARNATTPDMGAWEFAPAVCVAPPTAGTSTTSLTGPVCPGTLASFNLVGNSFGLTQTYQWEFSTNIAGPYTNVGTSSTNSSLNTTVNLTGFYRAKVTCSGNTTISTPVQIFVNQALPGGTYTINSTQAASATNFVSFNAAYQAMKCGILGPIVLNVTTPANTVYTEQLLMDSIQGMNVTNTITWNGNNNIIRFASLNSNERGVIRLNGVKHMTFDGLVVEPLGSTATDYGHGFHLQNNADSNTIKNSVINLSIATTSTNFAGIVIAGGNTATTTTTNGCDANLIDNNTINGGYYGITLAGNATSRSVNNRITRNKIKDHYFYGIYNTTSDNTLIESNELSSPTRTLGTTTYGIYTTGLLSNLIINKNRVFDFFNANTTSTSIGYGIYSNADASTVGQEIKIINNAIYGWKGQGTHYGIYIFSDFSTVDHNTIDFADQTANGTGLTYGIFYAGASNPTTIRNNNISITKSGTSNKFGLYFATTPSTYVSNNNNYYINTANGFVGFNGTNRQTLANWQAATGQEANSVSSNPLYINAATGNLQPFSVTLDNKAMPIGVTSDIINAPRSATTPDIGAWEFAIPPCTAPPVASTASANPNTAICMGTNVALRLTGIVFGSGQTYQWQTAPAAAGPWTNLGGNLQFPDTTVVASATTYYRCLVTCSGQTTPSSTVLVSLNAAFLAGTYTINPALPVSATNFTSFNSAVAALYCGITGHVIFNVASGTHTEQVRVGLVPGVGPNATVTFQSATGNASDVTLTFNPTVAANNYTLLLDSTGFFTFRNMTITGTNATQGRVIELRSLANNNTIRNNVVNAVNGTSAATTQAAIFSNNINGIGKNLISNNIISGGNFGITLTSLNSATRSFDNIIDSNTFNNNFAQSINLQMLNRSRVSNNTINRTVVGNATAYGINMVNCDSANVVNKNIVNISNAGTATVYGIYLGTNFAANNNRGMVTNNTVLATSGNSGTLYGLYQTGSTFQVYRNNVVSILSTTVSGAVYGLFHTNGTVFYENNTINNRSTSTATTNVAAHLNQTTLGSGQSFAQNNIFAATGGGRAIYMANANFVYSDYNMLYTSGTVLAMLGTVAQNNLLSWVNSTNWDYNSISYQPTFTSATDLTPNLTDPKVWGMHGRGVQIVGNDKDFNGSTRPVTFQQGVPDLGAYEFVPTSTPENLVATPAVPAANSTQKFSLGTDTVSIIKWGANVPASISGKRFTGTLPTVLTAGQQAMYFYVDYDVPAGSYNYEITQNYMNPWRGFLPNETVGRLGRTNAANAWLVGPTSTNDTISNFVVEQNLSFVDKFTVLTDGTIPPPPPIDPIVLDTSNMGTRFWVGYGHNQLFSGNSQEMVLYLGGSATPATVTVRINGTNWIRTYNIPANTIIPSNLIPKSGLFDARLINDGWSERGISITSNVPIVAYAHGYGSASSGASMLMPVGVYGYEYYSTNFRQNYAADCYSWFYVVADRNNTKIEITPSNPTRDGRPANVSFIVTLNKGEVYQVLGAIQTGSRGFDMTGSRAKAIQNSEGKCHPFAFFSGSSRTAIYCGGQESTGNGDYINQQNFPSQAWGKRYLVAPTSNSSAANSFHQNIFRVVVKDPTTIVQRNGVTLTGLVNNRFYEFDSQTADYITADKPVMVAQYMASSSSNCTNVAGNGDPEMIYVSPIEQGIKSVVLYRNTQQAITTNDVQVIIPTGGVASLLIDGSNTFTHTYPHPSLPGFTVVIRRFTAAATQTTVKSDSAFTLITYGMGSVESYGYNGGTLVKNLNAVTAINNTLATGVSTSPYTCAGTPFRFRVLLSVQPSQMTWQFSQVPGLTPSADVVVNNPVNIGTQIINGNTYYLYSIPTDYTFAAPGNYVVPVNMVHPSFEGCNSSQDITVSVEVRPEPVSDFITTYSGCVGDLATFNASIIQNPGVTTTSWNWNFGDATTGTGQMVTKQYNTPGTYQVKLNVIGSDGCLGDTTKPIVVNPRPVVALVSDSLSICINTNGTFTVLNPITGATYNWYNAATGGTLLGTGSTFTVNNVTNTTQVWVEGIVAGCNSVTRKRAIITVLPLLTAPIVTVDTVTVNTIRWKWNAVTNAISYSVSSNNGTTWTVPSSGATGLTHTITGLNPLTTLTLLVRANGGCQDATSAPVSGRTLTDQIYLPNSFSPNGDGLNDVWRVYGYVIKTVRISIFNQWGERIFTSSNQGLGWDGTYKGKKQPAGVYMYVVDMTLNDGSKEVKKGAINLVY